MWHSTPLTEIKQKLKTDLQSGLSQEEARSRLAIQGPNIFTEEDRKVFLDIFFTQIKSPLVFVLVLTGLATLFLHEYLDAIVIAIALLINMVIGVVQEKRADSAFEKLKKSQQKYTTVLRDGKKTLILSENLVVGDIVIVEAGSFVPADARVITSSSFAVNESALTGEWAEISKEPGEIDKKAPMTDQSNMIWMGTIATGGFVRAVVVATGDDTKVGLIAKELSSKEDITPLQKSIRKLAAYLTIVILFALVFILVIGLIQGQSAHDMLLVAIAIAVAAMPEGLPAAVTVVLALGMESILKKKGLVRNLLAAETLGSTTVILTDKTGTLTKAKMRVAAILTLSSIQKEKEGTDTESLIHGSDERDVLAMAMLTSDAFVEGYDDALSEWVVRGRPVERAILLAGIGSGLNRDTLVAEYPEFDSIPFESAKRLTVSLNYIESRKKQRMYFSGSPELLLEHSTYVYKDGKKVKLSEKAKKELGDTLSEKASQGMRLIAIAYRETDLEKFTQEMRDDVSTLFTDIVFGGFIVIHDPLRPDVAKSISKARKAGARVIMVTGDNENTAHRIAVEAGIAPVSGQVLTGTDIAEYTNAELLNALNKVRIFARVLPDQKMRIVKVLKDADEVVAMTGDGVNDAPALRRADIGVALGSGTEVAKEASDMILLDNSFTVIVKAIEEGRRILDNLKKIVAYLLSTSFSEIFVVGGALIAGAPLPILPAQILWTNIVEEGFMNFSFAFEPAESDVMKRDPSSSKMRNILTPKLRSLILILSLVTGILLTAIYFILLNTNLPIEKIRTLMFMVLSVDSIFFSLSLKDLHKPLWRINIFSNKYLIFALITSFAALLLAVFVPILRKLLSLTPVSALDLLFVLLVGLLNVFIIEIVKYFYFERKSVKN
ncbi:cation-translocating P-type ATPase [Patescibacteria group bacterium]